jgi:hypothetical protein
MTTPTTIMSPLLRVVPKAHLPPPTWRSRRMIQPASSFQCLQHCSLCLPRLWLPLAPPDSATSMWLPTNVIYRTHLWRTLTTPVVTLSSSHAQTSTVSCKIIFSPIRHQLCEQSPILYHSGWEQYPLSSAICQITQPRLATHLTRSLECCNKLISLSSLRGILPSFFIWSSQRFPTSP